MDMDHVHYLAYMLRLWQVRIDGDVAWRASIENPHTGERHGFANLDRLFEFLEEQTLNATECEEGNCKSRSIGK